MPKRNSKRLTNEVVGVFVLLTMGIVLAAIVLGPHTRRWFTPSRKLTILLPPEGSLGLRKGADVLILGTVVGSVDDISVNDAGNMEAEVSIRGNFIRFVRTDSKALIRKPFGIGDPSIEISRGKGAAVPLIGATIQSSADKAPTEMMQETMDDIRTQAVPALEEIRTAVREYTQLAAELRKQQPGLADAIGHFNRAAAGVEGGKGLAGMLVSDPAPADALRTSLPVLTSTIADLHTTAADLRKLTASLPELRESIQQSADEAPGVLMQADQTLLQIERLTEALQRNWLISGDMAHGDAAQSRRIDPLNVGTER